MRDKRKLRILYQVPGAITGQIEKLVAAKPYKEQQYNFLFIYDWRFAQHIPVLFHFPKLPSYKRAIHLNVSVYIASPKHICKNKNVLFVTEFLVKLDAFFEEADS